MEIFTSGLPPYIVLTALCACLFLTGLVSVPPTDRDEARFMQATKQMLESGDTVTIRFQDEVRTKKPVGIHWLQVVFVKAFAGGDAMAVWAYRLPSVVASWLTVICVFILGRRLFNAHAGLLAAMLTACTVIVVAEAHLAKTDAVLLLMIVLAHMALAEFYLTKDKDPPPFRLAVLFWLALGLEMLIKGPVPVAVIAATIAALCLVDRTMQWLRSLHIAIGVPIAVACVLPWILLSFAAGQGDVIGASLVEDFFPKLIGGEEGHGAPPGTYTVLSPLLLWPASLMLLPGLIWAWKKREQREIRFVLAWAIATWVMFEVVPTKLPHYILPAIPTLALAAAGSIVSSDRPIPRPSRIIWCCVAALLALGLAWAASTYGGPLVLTGFIVAVLIGAAIYALRLSRMTYVFVPAVAIAVFGLVFGGYLPQLTHLTLSVRLSESVGAHGGGPVALTRYREPSAIYFLGTGTRLTNTRDAAAHIAADSSALAVVAEEELELVWDMLAANERDMIVLDHIEGYNYAKGRRENLVLLRSERTAR